MVNYKEQLLIIPSGSLDVLPSNETLSVGKVITWSGPAIAIGGLLFLITHPSHDVSFLHEEKINPQKIAIRPEKNNSSLIIKILKLKFINFVL
jgi:hypothetical protein